MKHITRGTRREAFKVGDRLPDGTYVVELYVRPDGFIAYSAAPKPVWYAAEAPLRTYGQDLDLAEHMRGLADHS